MRLASVLVIGWLVGCAAEPGPSLVLRGLVYAGADTDCSAGIHPIDTSNLGVVHVALSHPERQSFETAVELDPGNQSISIPEVPAGEEWDLRVSGFADANAYDQGRYSWLGRRRDLTIASGEESGVGVLLLRVEAMQCSRAPMVEPAMMALATRLPSGHVLITGGVDTITTADCDDCRYGMASRNAYLYDPSAGAFQPLPPMPDSRVGHAAAVLDDGRVVVVGGADRVRLGGATQLDIGSGNLRGDALIFDPEASRWTSSAAPWGRRAFHTVTRLDTTIFVAAGGFADADRVHGDLIRFQVIGDSVRVDGVEDLACPRVGHQAFAFDNQVILWGGSRCQDGSSTAPEHWSPNNGLRLSRANRWGGEANLSFAAAVELTPGTFMIAGGSVYRNGTMETPHSENSYYYLAASEGHVRAPVLPQGVQGILNSGVRLSSGERALFTGGFEDLDFTQPVGNYVVFTDNENGFGSVASLPGLGGGVAAAAAAENQVILAGGSSRCPSCDGDLSLLAGGAVFASADDH